MMRPLCTFYYKTKKEVFPIDTDFLGKQHPLYLENGTKHGRIGLIKFGKKTGKFCEKTYYRVTTKDWPSYIIIVDQL